MQLDLNDGWQKIYEAELQSQPSLVPNRYYPIPAFIINQSFTSELVIGALNPVGKPTWRLAFYASQIVQIQGIGSVEIRNARIPLGASLLTLEDETPSYKLKVAIPVWHRQMNIEIWQYTGPRN